MGPRRRRRYRRCVSIRRATNQSQPRRDAARLFFLNPFDLFDRSHVFDARHDRYKSKLNVKKWLDVLACPHCPRTFRSKYGRDGHVKREHRHEILERINKVTSTGHAWYKNDVRDDIDEDFVNDDEDLDDFGDEPAPTRRARRRGRPSRRRQDLASFDSSTADVIATLPEFQPKLSLPDIYKSPLHWHTTEIEALPPKNDPWRNLYKTCDSSEEDRKDPNLVKDEINQDVLIKEEPEEERVEQDIRAIQKKSSKIVTYDDTTAEILSYLPEFQPRLSVPDIYETPLVWHTNLNISLPPKKQEYLKSDNEPKTWLKKENLQQSPPDEHLTFGVKIKEERDEIEAIVISSESDESDAEEAPLIPSPRLSVRKFQQMKIPLDSPKKYYQ